MTHRMHPSARACTLALLLAFSCTATQAQIVIDSDFDAVADHEDNCPLTYNPDQEDADCDGIGDVCDPQPHDGVCIPPDTDSDGIEDALDNCPLAANPAQEDSDCDGHGDACDPVDDALCTPPDTDGDGIPDASDDCPAEDASGRDADKDGCIDSVEDVVSVIGTLDLSEDAGTVLLTMSTGALQALEDGDAAAATAQLGAMLNYVNAQEGRRITLEAAGTLRPLVSCTIVNTLNSYDLNRPRLQDLACDATPTAVFTVVDTDQQKCYGLKEKEENEAGDMVEVTYEVPCEGPALFGQDGAYERNPPGYTLNRDLTVTDNNTGLVWAKRTIKDVTFNDAEDVAKAATIGGHTDWRVPDIKELYSLIDFSGSTGDGSPDQPCPPPDAEPYIDDFYFDFSYADPCPGGVADDPTLRYIDAQYLTTTDYVGITMIDDDSFFGVNFADGRIKAYAKGHTAPDGSTTENTFNLRLVRGTQAFRNDFVLQQYVINARREYTISDRATGLLWMQQDSGAFPDTAGTEGDGSMDWAQALAWCEHLVFAGRDDWRLPNAKELQSIVDYSRSPDTSGSAAINKMFEITSILDPEDNPQYPYFWTSTTHRDGKPLGHAAVYIAFGEAQGVMRFDEARAEYVATDIDDPNGLLLDVHGAGAQRSDPKNALPEELDPKKYPDASGPQGDIRYVFNYARCVTDDVD